MSTTVTLTLHTAEVNAAINAAAVRATRIGAEVLLEKSKDHVPHDKGILENSGSVDYQSSPPKATVFYDTLYAIRLHEHPEYKFKGKGQGKWLQNAAINNKNLVKKAIEKAMKEGLQ